MPSIHHPSKVLLALLLGTTLLVAACAGATATPTATSKPKPAASPSPSPSPSPAAVPSPSPSPVNPATLTKDVLPAPSGATIRITSPAANASVPAGDIRVSYEVVGVTLVAAAQATRVQDLHVHVLCDVDPAPYLGTTTDIPAGRPDIIHTAETQATCPSMRSGPRRVAVILTAANHISVNPPVSATASFTVQ